MQVRSLAGERVVGLLGHLDVEVAGRPTAGSDLALSGQPDAHAVLDAGRHVDGDGPAGTNPAFRAARRAGGRDLLPSATAGGARTACHHLAEKRPLHRLNLAGTAADGAGPWRRARRAPAASARGAEHCRFDGDVLARAECGLGQGEVQPQQRVGTLPTPRSWPSACRSSAEERLENVAKASKPGKRVPGTAGRTGAGRQRVAA